MSDPENARLFAVQFRYSVFEFFEDGLDRPGVIQQVAGVVDHIEALARNQRA